MGGALLSGGHQSSSPFIVGFAGVILAQEGLRRAKLLSRMMNTKHSAPYRRDEIWREQLPQVRDCCWGEPENTVTFPRSINYRNQIIYFDPKKTSRIVIKKILNYYHYGEKCGKLLVGMSEKSKRVSEK